LPEPPELVPIPPIEKVPKEQVQALQSPPTSPPAHKNCVPQRKPYEAPEMVLVVDGSGSMSDPISGAPTRLDAAKRSISELVDGLPGDVDVGLIEFSDCDRVNRDKFYRVSERGQLKQRVNGLLPREGTPLGLSVERAGRIISSRRPGVIVVVSDGMDSCLGDPCGAAQRIAAKKPNVRINVVDISGSSGNPTARCMAQATRGRVFQPNSVGEMEVMVQQAGGEPDIRLCK
jgi:Mg-chelatase subunit ChlD